MGADATSLKRDPDGFRLRGSEMTRIETFTDAAFAFALTLLVISNDPIASVPALSLNLRMIPAFLLSGAMLMMFWWGHHQWSRRYGLDDATTVILSILLVFTMLVYVYPLRLVFGSFMYFIGLLTGLPLDHPAFELVDPNSINVLFVVYGAGFVAMSGLLALLTRHAWRLRDELGLDDVERLITRSWLGSWLILTAVGTVSILIALIAPPWWYGAPGWAYAVLGIIMPWYGARSNRRLRALTQTATTALPAA